MPRGDQTGPWGAGPRTGRGLGFCRGFSLPGFLNRGFGFGRGPGRGFGRWMGFANWTSGWWGMPFQGIAPSPAPVAPDLEVLKQQADILEQQLQAVREQINKRQPEGEA